MMDTINKDSSKTMAQNPTQTKKTVAIIGAGLCGMAMVKACLEYDLQPTVFERTAYSGGLWRFREKIETGQASVMRSTIVNSSKEMTAFSDFPFPAHFPNFMPNELMYEYLLSFGESFHFDSYVRYEHEVIQITHAQEPNEGYDLVVKDVRTGEVQKKRYDAVAVCSGHNHTPSMPKYPGQESFQGKILHAHAVRTNEHFKDKRVVVVGIGNSGGDVAAEAAPIAKQVYISSRRGGTWLVRRTGLNGRPIDTVSSGLRIFNFSLHCLPYSCRCSIGEFCMQRLVGHELLGLQPDNTKFFSQHFMVNDYLPTYIHTGWIKMRYDIERFTKNGVIFEGDHGHITECDIVVMATGYQLTFPFIAPSVFDQSNIGYQLYKHVFDPKQPQPERFAFIGLPKANGSLPPIAEMQSRWFCMLLTGKCKPLPNQKQMYKQIQRTRKRIAFRFGPDHVDKNIFEVEFMSYMDSLAKSAGLMPPISKYLFTDPKLWWALIFKPGIAAQYRLRGSGAKPKQSRELIMTIMDRIKEPYKKPTPDRVTIGLKDEPKDKKINKVITNLTPPTIITTPVKDNENIPVLLNNGAICEEQEEKEKLIDKNPQEKSLISS